MKQVFYQNELSIYIELMIGNEKKIFKELHIIKAKFKKCSQRNHFLVYIDTLVNDDYLNFLGDIYKSISLIIVRQVGERKTHVLSVKNFELINDNSNMSDALIDKLVFECCLY